MAPNPPLRAFPHSENDFTKWVNVSLFIYLLLVRGSCRGPGTRNQGGLCRSLLDYRTLHASSTTVAALPERAQCRKAPPSRRAAQATPSGTVSLTQIPRHPLHYYIFLDFTFTLAKDLGWLCPIVILK